MKKLFSFVLAVLMSLTAATFTFSASAEAEPFILEGKGIINTPYRLTYEEKNENGISYVHFEPDLTQSAIPKEIGRAHV